MSVLWFGDLDGVPLDEAKVRATTAPVEQDAPAAEQDHSPEFNEVTTDPNPNLGGLSSRQLASDWHESKQDAPIMPELATADHNVIVNRQVATSGTAAAREMSGQNQRGTVPYAIGIEPVIRDGSVFGADYFAVEKRGANEDPEQQTRGVQPTGLDRDVIAGAMAYGNQEMREANNNMAAFYRMLVG